MQGDRKGGERPPFCPAPASAEKNLKRRRRRVRRQETTYCRKRYIESRKDPIKRIEMSYRSLVTSAFKRQGYSKNSKTHILLGCDFDTLCRWIESQWEPWMGWHNHGVQKKNGPRMWHIDHRRPISHFDLSKPEQARMAFHYTNCRPLCAVQNISEGNRRPFILALG